MDEAVKQSALSAAERRVYSRLMQKAATSCHRDSDHNDDCYDIETGPDCVSGSQLPSHSDVNKSCLTNQRIVVGRVTSSRLHFLYVRVRGV